MPETTATKALLAQSLKELMKVKPFQKINVSEIAKNCGLTRQAFYYHFKDKYDLMNWVYYFETAPLLTNFEDTDKWTAALVNLCHYMQANKEFYINAFRTTGQNSFPQYLRAYINTMGMAILENALAPEFEREKWQFIIDFFGMGVLGVMMEWADKGMQEVPEQFMGQVQGILDGSLFALVEEKMKEKRKTGQ